MNHDPTIDNAVWSTDTEKCPAEIEHAVYELLYYKEFATSHTWICHRSETMVRLRVTGIFRSLDSVLSDLSNHLVGQL